MSDDIEKINSELSRYSPELATRPQIIAANKFDLIAVDGEVLSDDVDIPAFEKFVSDNGWGEPVYISAATGEGLDSLVRRAAEMLAVLPPIAVYESDYSPEEIAAGTGDRQTEIRNENGRFIVEGDWLYNLLGQINIDDYESLAFFGKVIENAGVIDLLRKKGAKDGDTVSIYGFEFDFVN